MTLVNLPCTARELESALHAICDHHGAWDAQIHYGLCDEESFCTGVKVSLTLKIETETKEVEK